MLDKIIISSDRKEASLVFTDSRVFTISSSTDVLPILLWFLDSPCARLVSCDDTVVGLEVRRNSDDEVTDVRVAS